MIQLGQGRPDSLDAQESGTPGSIVETPTPPTPPPMSSHDSDSNSDSDLDTHSRSATPAYPTYSPYNQPLPNHHQPSPENSDDDDDDDDEDDDDDDSDDDEDDQQSEMGPTQPAGQPAPAPVTQLAPQTEASLPLAVPVPTYNFSQANPRPPLQAAQAQGLMRVLVGNELRKAGYETADEDALDALVGAVDERQSWTARSTLRTGGGKVGNRQG